MNFFHKLLLKIHTCVWRYVESDADKHTFVCAFCGEEGYDLRK